MKYNTGQELAITGMVEWEGSKHTTTLSRMYTLDGAAGVGKTTVIKEVIKRFKVDKKSVAVSAPTHAAKKQIELATSFSGFTIQKLLGLRPDVNMEKFDINNPKFRALGVPYIQFFKVLVIDECSMLNKDVFELVQQAVNKYKLLVIFIGDSYQLPPIGEDISKVFSIVKNQSTLTEVVRQEKDNPMITILQLLRKDIDNGTDYGVEELTSNGAIVIADKGFKCLASTADTDLGKATFGQEMIKLYTSEEYKKNKKHIKFIAYTNDTVIEWSNLLRERLLGNKASRVVNVNEVLVGYSNVKENDTDLVVNSEEYEIIIETPMVSPYGVKGHSVTMRNEAGYSSNVFIVDHADEDNLAKFREQAIPLLEMAQQKKGRHWVKWYQFKNAHLLLVDVCKSAHEVPTRWNKLCKKDLYYAYGSTVHKSQGATYTNTAVNLMDLYLNPNKNERARLVYVALSRCRKMNLILVM